MRRQFHLPENDTEYLDTSNLQWETILEAGHRWLLIHEYSIPTGYNHEKVSVALRIDPGYPNSQIDMAYFSPHVQRRDGKPIGALSMQVLDGKQWQRWSRHRTGANPWRPDVDDISTHMGLTQHWLEREFLIR